MTKRIVGIVCLLMVCLLGGARDVEHNFHDDSGTTPKKLTWENTNYKIGYYDDGTVYTCLGGSTFAFYNQICILIPSGDSVIVSPARVQLKELEIYLMSAMNMAVSVSADSVTWVPIGNVGRLGTNRTDFYWWDSMRGNYYISLKNVGSGPAYIYKIDYLYHDAPDPESCNCFPAVLE